MFLIEKDSELNTLELGKIINEFQTKELINLKKYYNYYKGKQQITEKTPTDDGKPCNKVCVNYCYNIVSNYLGYLTGIDIAYSSEKNFEDIQEVLNYNDIHNTDSELLRNALIYGVAYEINYVDEDGFQRFKVLDSREVIPVYDNTLNQNLVYAIRFYKNGMINSDEFVVEVYSSSACRKYKSSNGFSSFTLLEEIPHYFGQVPITVFSLNAEEDSIFDKIITLQDAYNEIISGEVDDFQTFADAYLVMKGVYAKDEDLKDAKTRRAFMIDPDADISYLTKDTAAAQTHEILQNINDAIHKIANSPDFNDEKLLAQSGIAMRYKLVGFENAASSIEANMKKALQKRIELICEVLNLKGEETLWRDIHIQFTRNLPSNLLETTQIVNSLRGLVSDETLLSLLPFVSDAAAEIDKLNAQKEANMSLYNFSSGNTDEEEDVDE